eukprot:m.64876 g.64876  ORF g.64876 m.64876 type:complete len:882 (-) comp14011_c0_seq2:38-2683(-)
MAANSNTKGLSLGSRKLSTARKQRSTVGLPTFNTPKLPALVRKPAKQESPNHDTLLARQEDENTSPVPMLRLDSATEASTPPDANTALQPGHTSAIVHLQPSPQLLVDYKAPVVQTMPCPLCDQVFPSDVIQQHAATCLDQFQSEAQPSKEQPACTSTATISASVARQAPTTSHLSAYPSDMFCSFSGTKCPICKARLKRKHRLTHVKRCAKLNSIAPADLIALLRSTDSTLLSSTPPQSDFQSPAKKPKRSKATASSTDQDKALPTVKPSRKKVKSNRKLRATSSCHLVPSADLAVLLPLHRRRLNHVTRSSVPAAQHLFRPTHSEVGCAVRSTTLFWLSRQACSIASGYYNQSLMSGSALSETKRHLADVDEELCCWPGDGPCESSVFAGLKTATPSPKHQKKPSTAPTPSPGPPHAPSLPSVSAVATPNRQPCENIHLSSHLDPSLEQFLARMSSLEALADVEITSSDPTLEPQYFHRLVLEARMPQLAEYTFQACQQHVSDRVLPRHCFQPSDTAIVSALFALMYQGQTVVSPHVLAKLHELCAITADDVLRTALAPHTSRDNNDMPASQTSGFMVLDIADVFGVCSACDTVAQEATCPKVPLPHRALSIHETNTPEISHSSTRTASPSQEPRERSTSPEPQKAAKLAEGDVPTTIPSSNSPARPAIDLEKLGTINDSDEDDELPDVSLSTLTRSKPPVVPQKSDDEELPPTGLDVSLHSQHSLPAFQPDNTQTTQESPEHELRHLSFDALRKEAGDYGLKTRGVGRSELIKELTGIRVQKSQQGYASQAESEVEDSLDESVYNRDSALTTAIQGHSTLYERVLMLEPISITELLQVCTEHDIPFKALELQEYCDMHTITWTSAKTRKRQMKRVQKK